jgi:hypothetical protein
VVRYVQKIVDIIEILSEEYIAGSDGFGSLMLGRAEVFDRNSPSVLEEPIRDSRALTPSGKALRLRRDDAPLGFNEKRRSVASDRSIGARENRHLVPFHV